MALVIQHAGHVLIARNLMTHTPLALRSTKAFQALSGQSHRRTRCSMSQCTQQVRVCAARYSARRCGSKAKAFTVRTTVVGRRCGGVIKFKCKRDNDTFFSHRPGFDLLARLVADLTWASLSRIALPLRIQAFIPPTHIRLAGDVSPQLLEPSRTSEYHVESLILLQNKKEG